MEVQIGGKSVSVGNLLVIVGGILAIIAMFLAWSVWSGGGESVSFAGTNLMNGLTIDGLEILPGDQMSFVKFMPILTLIFGVIAIIGAILPMISSINEKTSSIICAVSGLLVVIFAVLFIIMGSGSGLVTGELYKYSIDMMIEAGMSIDAGIGCYLGLIGGILALVGGGLAFKDNM